MVQRGFWQRHPMLNLLWAFGRGVLIGLALMLAPRPIKIIVGIGVLVWLCWVLWKMPPIGRRSSCKFCGKTDTIPVIEDLRPVEWWQRPRPTVWVCIDHFKELAQKHAAEASAGGVSTIEP